MHSLSRTRRFAKLQVVNGRISEVSRTEDASCIGCKLQCAGCFKRVHDRDVGSALYVARSGGACW